MSAQSTPKVVTIIRYEWESFNSGQYLPINLFNAPRVDAFRPPNFNPTQGGVSTTPADPPRAITASNLWNEHAPATNRAKPPLARNSATSAWRSTSGSSRRVNQSPVLGERVKGKPRILGHRPESSRESGPVMPQAAFLRTVLASAGLQPKVCQETPFFSELHKPIQAVQICTLESA